MSYHVTVVFVGGSQYQQVPMLNFTAARQPCIAWNPPITEKQNKHSAIQIGEVPSVLLSAPLMDQAFCFFFFNQVEVTVLTNKSRNL